MPKSTTVGVGSIGAPPTHKGLFDVARVKKPIPEPVVKLIQELRRKPVEEKVNGKS